MLNNIENIVRQYVNFRHGVSGQGWNVVFCEVCGDGSRRKGPRGGWSFTDAGQTAFYHCFNCGCNENFSSLREHKFSKGMKNVLDSFGVPSSAYNSLLLINDKDIKRVKVNQSLQHTFIDIPDHFQILQDCKTEEAKNVKIFLKNQYGITTKDYSFYIGSGTTKSDNPDIINEAKSFKNRLIIPYFKNGNLIYYQARDVSGKSKLKYLSPSIPKTNILFNIDQIYRITDSPLYVTEGAFDAIHLNGVSTLSNELSQSQIEILKSSKRPKVLVPDFNGDNCKMCDQFTELGWNISFPEFRNTCKDVSEAVVKYGRLYSIYDICNNIKTPSESSMLLKYMNVLKI